MPPVHVMVGIIRDDHGNVLINQRPDGKIQAGRWEFPGGKLAVGEGPVAGLSRELHEELGIHVESASPLIRLEHAYAEFSVRLDVYEVDRWSGHPEGLENQRLRWVNPEFLKDEDILEADLPIINAVRLPDTLLITPDPVDDDAFLEGLRQSLDDGIRIVQFRAHQLDDEAYVRLGRKVSAFCRSRGTCLLLNRRPEFLEKIPADGIHLTADSAARLSSRPVSVDTWFSTSCHSREELAMAGSLGADFCVLGPVSETLSHPGGDCLGWDGFRTLVDSAGLPVFALGGLSSLDIERARRFGGQGVAGIRAFWKA